MNATYGGLWIDVEQCTNCWYSDLNMNTNYLYNASKAAQEFFSKEGKNRKVGIYSSVYEWKITVETNDLSRKLNLLKVALLKLQLTIADKRFSDKEISTLSLELAAEVELEMRTTLDFVIYILSNCIQIFSHFCEAGSIVGNSQASTSTNNATNTSSNNNSDTLTISTSRLTITSSEGIKNSPNTWSQNNKNYRKQKILTYITSREDVDFMNIIIDMLTTFRDSISKQYDGHFHSEHYYDNWSFLFNFQEATMQIVRSVVCTDKLKYAGQLAEYQFRDLFLSRGGCDVLVKYLGWPIEHVSILQDVEWYEIDILSLDNDRLNHYFQIQYLTMKIITKLIEYNYSYLRLFGKQGFARIRETGLWISFFFTLNKDYDNQTQTLRNNPLPQLGSVVRSRSGSLDLANFRFPPTPISNSSGLGIKSFPCPGFISKTMNERVMQFFDCLRKLVKLSTIISFPKTVHSSTPGTPSNNFAFPDTTFTTHLNNTEQDQHLQRKLSRLLFSFFIDENEKDQMTDKSLRKLKMISDFPLYFMDSINRLVSESQTALDVMVSNGLYDVLFSEYFYLYGGALNQLNRFEKYSQTDLQKTSEEEKFIFSKSEISSLVECTSAVLRSSVIDFLKYTATIRGRNNVEECRRLIDIMQLYKENSLVISEVGLCLLDIIRQNHDITQESLFSIKAMSVLSHVVGKQHAIIRKFETDNQQSQFYQVEYTEDHLRAIEARNIMLNILDFTLTFENSLTLALQNHNTLETLFKVILDPTLKNFVLVHVRQLMNTKNIEHSHEFEILLTYFTEVFPIIMDNPTQQNLQLLMEMLAAVQKGLCASNKKLLQTQFRDKLDKFMHLLNLDIPTIIPPNNTEFITRHCLAMEVIRTLTTLISDNSKSKHHFKSILGYDTFKNLILHCEQNNPSPEIFNVLFDMLADGEFDSETKYAIQNPDVARLIFHLSMHCELSYISSLVAKFSCLVQKSTNNRNICCSVGLISSLLDLLTRFEKESFSEEKTVSDIVNLIETIGRHSITVKELKGFLGLIKRQSDRDQSDFLALLLKALKNMTQSSPDAFFDFNGTNSGLVLPTIDNRVWPNTKGYSVSMWVRVESFVESRPSAPNSNPMTPISSVKSLSFTTDLQRKESFQFIPRSTTYKPRLISFYNSEGQGFEVYFEENSMNIVVQHSQKKQYIEKLNYKFEEKVWYHIVLTHSYGKGPFSFSKNELRLYINGLCVEPKIQLKYPSLHKPLDKCMIGSSYLVNESLQQGSTPTHKRQASSSNSENPNFNGQMGTICVFDETLLPNIIQLIYNLGYNYMNCFQPTDSVLAKQSQEYLQLFDGSITQKIILCYSPKARANYNKICLNNTPEAFYQLQLHNGLVSGVENVPQIKSDIHQAMLNSRILNGTQLCVTHNAKDIIGCLGGIKVLFPLFLQMDRLSHTDQVISEKADPFLVNTLFSLIIDLLSAHNDNLEDMARCRGFLVISFLLKQISPQHLTRNTVALIPSLLSCAKDHSVLYSDIVNYLVFNFRLWIYTDVEVQKLLFQQLLDISNEKKDNFTKIREILGVQKLLDLMRWFYWYERAKSNSTESEYQLGTEKICNPATGAVLGQRPSQENIYEIRQKLTKLLKCLTSKSAEIVIVNNDERLTTTTGTVLTTATSISYPELEAIINLLADCNDNMQYSDVVIFVLELLLSPDGVVIADMLANMKAYQVFVQLLYTHHEPTRLNILKCIGQMLILNPKLRQRVFAETSYGFSTITNILTIFNITIQTYGVLRDIFLGCISLNQRDILEFDGFEQTEQSYKVQAVLQPIFRLLVNTQPNVKHHILQNFKIVLKSNRAKDCLLQQVGWQEWLLNIICVSGISDASIPSDVGQSAQFELCKDIVIELIAILLYHSLKTVKKGWRDIEDTICQVILLKDREDIEGIEEILGSIYKRILDEYISDIQGERIIANYNDRNSPILDNFVHLATFIEEYMFYFDAIYQSVSGTWMRKTTESGTGVLGTLRSIVVGANTNRAPQEPGIMPLSQAAQQNQEDFVVIDTSSVSVGSHSEIIPSTPESKRGDQLSSNSPSTASNPLTYNVEDEINTRRDENNNWIDLPIAEKLITILSAWKLNTVSNYSSLRSVVQGGKRLRDGGTLRITLRLIRYCLRESPSLDSSLLDCIKRINQRDVESEKEILRFSELWAVTGDIENNDDFHTRLMFILAFLFDILSRLLEKKQEKEALFVFITIREIFMTRKEYLEQALTTDDDKSILTDDPVFSTKKKADLSDYLQVIHSKSWKFAWTRFFVPAVRLTEKLESAFLEEIIVRRKFTLHRLYDQIREVESAMSDLDKKMDSEIRSTLENIRRAERERIKKERSSYEEFDLLASHYWKQTMRNVADERGIWGGQKDSVKWKLDKCQNSKFIRTRLVRNFSEIDHKDATIKKTDKSVIVENTITNRLLEIKEKGSFFIPKLSIINNETEDASEDGTSEITAATISTQQPSTTNISEDIQINQKPVEREKTILKDVECDLISPMAGFSGKMEITSKRITWTPDKENHALNFGLDSERVSKLIKKPTEKTFTLDSIVEIRIMRYRLRKTALEFIFVDESSVLYNFNVNERNKIFNKIISQKCPNLRNVEKSFSPMENIQRSPWTKKWQLGKISNFDYLMILNMYAGRTFNDLSQYPIFPWVIADYTSPVLDFSKESTFRDLSKPMGVLNPDKVRIVEEKYQTLASDTYTTPYHYGSHYSTSAYVTYYLIRLEPYTTHARVVQGGKFDHADRMFESITQTFDHCLNGEGDHKELIPEFFYMPEFLRKPQDLELGEKQNGVHISDVVLPAWAKTPEDFIRIHREALESEYVSQHLNEWIDLIFGYKQRGPEAIKAYNVFPKLTYEGNISFDPQEFYQNMATIDSFGQTPSQLFQSSHPKKSITRKDKHETLLSLTVQCSKQINTSKVSPIVLIKLFHSENNITRLCVVNEDGFIYTTKMTNITLQTILSEYTLFNNCKTIGFPLDDPVGLLSSSTESNNFVPVNSNNSTKQRRSLASLPKQLSGIRSNVSACKTAFAIPSSTNPNSVKDITLISCRHHDNSFRISKPYTQPLQTKITLCQQNAIWRHKDLVTCCSICEEDKYLVTGSRDTTVMVWDILTNDFFTSQQPSTILYGHDDEVTCVVVCNDLDNVISGSRDGTIIIHSLRRGKYIRTIKHPNGGCINSIAVARECKISQDIEVLGRICVYSNDDMILYLYSANGQLLAKAETNGVLHCMMIFDSKYVIYGGDHSIVVRDLHSLKVIHKFTLSEYMSPIRTIEISKDEQLLFAGLDSGQLVVLATSRVVKSSSNSSLSNKNNSSSATPVPPQQSASPSVASSSIQNTATPKNHKAEQWSYAQEGKLDQVINNTLSNYSLSTNQDTLLSSNSYACQEDNESIYSLNFYRHLEGEPTEETTSDYVRGGRLKFGTYKQEEIAITTEIDPSSALKRKKDDNIKLPIGISSTQNKKKKHKK
ncbi:predicted protein [Naegleria gruberi]|uniref:Predicted protein n=1 Tax=Naegleria gruberi TaxID=5762 RepID=D2UYK5_NAEGR|nr:uncharacterized protein NAEGRDRAFT_45200 [Naegleria gruberi]EFC50489.1 predicted protein [Naegleria gruberi]|eukprot:XP_002683233.1 predicted protein [Naegleria gruberi strain NEG-M]